MQFPVQLFWFPILVAASEQCTDLGTCSSVLLQRNKEVGRSQVGGLDGVFTDGARSVGGRSKMQTIRQKVDGDRIELGFVDNDQNVSVVLFEYDFVKNMPAFGGVRHFKAKQGIPARVQMWADGRWRGYFALESGPVSIASNQKTTATSAMLQVQTVPVRTLLAQQDMTMLETKKETFIVHSSGGDGIIKVVQEEVDGSLDENAASVKATNNNLNDKEMPNADNWQGTPWFGGSTPCFPDDSLRWKMKIGVMVDGAALKDPVWEQKIIDQMNAGSIIYEKQMNIELEAAWIITADDGSNSANNLFKSSCPLWYGSEGDSLDRMLGALRNILEDPGKSGTTLTVAQRDEAVTTHLFTGCDSNGYGTVGLAGMGTLGDATSSGVNNLKSSWQTFAHELGHNFGAEHTFEEGSGGGIMDYDDGKTGGKHQGVGVGTFEFNALRQCQVCSELSSLRKSGHPGFYVEGGTPEVGETPLPAGCPCEDGETGYAWGGGAPVTCAEAESSFGWCGSRAWMPTKCPITCGVCSPGDHPTPTEAPEVAAPTEAPGSDDGSDDDVSGSTPDDDGDYYYYYETTTTTTTTTVAKGCSDTKKSTWWSPCFQYCSPAGASVSARCRGKKCTVSCTCGDARKCKYKAK